MSPIREELSSSLNVEEEKKRENRDSSLNVYLESKEAARWNIQRNSSTREEEETPICQLPFRPRFRAAEIFARPPIRPSATFKSASKSHHFALTERYPWKLDVTGDSTSDRLWRTKELRHLSTTTASH